MFKRKLKIVLFKNKLENKEKKMIKKMRENKMKQGGYHF